MKKNILTLCLLLIAVTLVIIVKKQALDAPHASVVKINGLPTFLDLGAGKCMSCKMMKPVLKELEEKFSGKLNVVFIDVHQDQQAARQYAPRVIPAQIFLDAEGNELFRHEGFLSEEDVLKKWTELGIEL